MANKIEGTVRLAVQPVIEANGMELVDVEYRKRDDMPQITVYIHKAGGVSLNDCELIHNAIDAPLDAADPTGGAPYVLNVSSPGLDRAFKYDSDFARNVGEELEIRFFNTFDGKKSIEAKLLSFNADTVTVLYQGRETVFHRDKLAKVSIAVKF